ncbi:PAS domain-containing protein [Mesorhizobium sp. M00.F.Ca.ET.186.01.1.1]|nr:PAS domain-containing protein [bacterium M00.F.Ca.ET.205.01.1.1]TGU51829.1 PAS domain-containing protein [bacterium M00.F.Ca.ET.152.01.1.1]TGV33230.1 PAS domain-containing protein [Mesorhizobium sp. M00.F.Ca.ET.186.01.1.1]TGZ42368.1 PAS domain-containing protein [bacterium M00.F.Ca.ET.162.01.1.1]TIW62524.1 MAG: PAS domain-containing protein [Mesorhizobium sp.]
MAGTRRRAEEVGPDDSRDSDAEARTEDPCPIVAIGASAGGIAALQRFFPSVPPDGGLAYVVIQHLDAEHESVLASIIQRSTSIEVETAAEGAPIEPNRIYVIPPGVSVTVRNRSFHVAVMATARTKRTPIDDFFVSLAEEQGESAAGVILSGTGSDGTVGLKSIKEHGGLTLAQESAEYDGMMRSAVQTGLVDLVLPAEEMAEKLVEYFRHANHVVNGVDRDQRKRDVSDQLSRIAALLRARTGHDFSGYKDNTILRRIQRRMQLLQIVDPSAFYERLREEPQQVDFLFQDLLIGVTNLFRDPHAFDALERLVIPKLFENRKPDDTVRVWVPGCATGEEAYSIAMLLRENAPRGAASPKLQIFATDIDERALEVARAGRYPAAIANDVSPKRLKEFFSREDGTYRVSSDLREICLFSTHNLLRDPPFSRLDLITCRNLLIYMGSELQEKIIPIFHYALRKDGYLFLGSSENVTRHARLFTTVDKAARIFQRRGSGTLQKLPEFPLAAAARRPAEHARQRITGGGLQENAERLLLDRYSPAYVVVNVSGELVHSSGGTGKYLELAAGAPDNNIFAMARRGLRMDLRAGLHKTVSTGQVSVQNNITIGTNGGRQIISLVVQPLPPDGTSDPLFMLVFKDMGGLKPEADHEPVHSSDDVESANVNQLEKELRETRERLQITTEELESSNEELKSSNEELSSINEELQSSNEELETSKEELQSINEELQTVNAELNIRVDELSRANNDIANLLESTQIATVFLDRDLCIKSFTPATRDLFRLVESDVGRPLAHVRPRFAADSLQADIEQVLQRLGTIEREVSSIESSTRYIMRVLPYRTVDNVIAGVVVTFVDITKMARAEERIGTLAHDLRNRIESLETLLDLVPVGILIAEDGPTPEMRANRHAAELAGQTFTGAKLISLPASLPLTINGNAMAAKDQPLAKAMRTGEAVPQYEARIENADGSRVDIMMSANPLFDENGKVRGAIGAMVDISRHKRAERDQERLLHELQHRVKNILATVAALTSRMVRSSHSVAEFSTAFQERLQAMARTHELLSQYNWEGADFGELLKATLAPYIGEVDRQALVLEGPSLRLNAGAAATFGLVFFELASNAAKYGAYLGDKGRVEVSWQVGNPSGLLSILWKEVGGPPVTNPVRTSFGTAFIQQSLQYEMSGSADLEFKGSGLECRMQAPLAKMT